MRTSTKVKDVTGFVDLLSGVNKRQELMVHDLELVDLALADLAEAFRERAETLVQMVATSRYCYEDFEEIDATGRLEYCFRYEILRRN